MIWTLDVDNETDCDSDALSDDEHDRALQIEEQILETLWHKKKNT